MTVVPLPDVPCVRVRVIYNKGAVAESGNRFYLSYSGSAPTGANCTTLASDIATQWGGGFMPNIGSAYTLEEVDVLDIATNSGLSGQWTGSTAGGRTGNQCQANVSTNLELGIARRYRGGKPRIFLPPPDAGELSAINAWTSAFVNAINAAAAAVFGAIEGLSIGAMGTLQHVTLSYYSGFTNITNSSGRERAVPTYRATAKHDVVTSYSCKQIIGSQRRRRTSTTP